MSEQAQNQSHGHPQADEKKLQDNMAAIGKKILVLSGKGGVGKSTVAANIAMELAQKGYKVGLLDIDFHGPSIPRLTGLTGQKSFGTETELMPVPAGDNLRVMSIAFLLQDDSQAVVWRGPMKYSVIQKLLADTVWGDLDYLVVDAPPGTGDEPLSIAQLVGNNAGAILVTTPQRVAIEDVRRCVTFCKQVFLPIWGIVENMAGFVCPKCEETIDIFGKDGGKQLAEEFNIDLLSRIPMDSQIAAGADEGDSIANSSVSKPVREALDTLINKIVDKTQKKNENKKKEESNMKIAIPVVENMLSMHFGHCDQFTLIDVDVEGKKIVSTTSEDAPPHEPGLLPVWLHEKGVNLIIAGGMGQRAQSLFTEKGIKVLTGASSEAPEKVVTDWLENNLQLGDNVCDH
ncbi:MAG: iron-sulfur cluster carrier protein MrpORP [Sedimentisphaeraceae bacterium JB056]